IEQLLKLRHELNLAAALQNIGALFSRDYRIAIEVGRALFELRKIFHGLQGPLGTEQALDIHAAQRRSIQPMPVFLRPDVTYQVRRAVGMSVGVAIETGHPAAWSLGTAVAGLIELLLRKRRQQEPQSFDLLRVQNAVEQFKEIVDGHEFALRDVAQVQARSQKNGGGKLREKMVRQIKIQIEPGQIPPFLFLDFVNLKLRKDHAAV